MARHDATLGGDGARERLARQEAHRRRFRREEGRTDEADRELHAWRDRWFSCAARWL